MPAVQPHSSRSVFLMAKHRGQFGGQYRSADNLAAYERMLANASLRIDRHGARFVGVALPDGWTLPPNRMPAVVVGDLARGPE
jgi:hypothetical protein